MVLEREKKKEKKDLSCGVEKCGEREETRAEKKENQRREDVPFENEFHHRVFFF